MIFQEFCSFGRIWAKKKGEFVGRAGSIVGLKNLLKRGKGIRHYFDLIFSHFALIIQGIITLSDGESA
jgi:hypothetical protein